ncbi:MAG: hypothetical protein IPN69_09785 [Acidobacteria bacterium]|nr:hypothetical protein [Acidobacteriota bacterium]
MSTDNLIKIAFANDERGWVINKSGKLLRTDDGGVTWRTLSLPVRGFPAGISFTNPNIGLIALNIKSKPGAGDESAILRTEDGGESWATTYSGDVGFSGLRSFDGSTWAFGLHVIQQKNSVFSEIVLLKTTDTGATWANRAAGANRLNDESSGDSASDLLVFNDRLVLKTTRNRFLETNDDGKTWVAIDSIKTGHLGPRFLNSGDGRISLAAGTPYGRATYFMFREAPGKWSWIARSGFNALDALFVSPNEILACGTVRLRIKGIEYAYDDKVAAAVLYSPDSGRTWKVVFQEPRIVEFQTIGVTTNGRVFVAGANQIISSTLEEIRSSVAGS